MGNQQTSMAYDPKPVGNLELMHIGSVTRMEQEGHFCLLKAFSYSDPFLAEDKYRKIKTRISKPNHSLLDVYQAHKMERKDLCANNYELHVYLEQPQSTLQHTINQRLQEKKSYTEEELYHFLAVIVDSLIYIQDNGHKNIHLDSQSIFFCG